MSGFLLLVTGLVGLAIVSATAAAFVMRAPPIPLDGVLWGAVGFQLLLMASALADWQSWPLTLVDAFALMVHVVVVLFAGLVLGARAAGPPDLDP